MDEFDRDVVITIVGAFLLVIALVAGIYFLVEGNPLQPAHLHGHVDKLWLEAGGTDYVRVTLDDGTLKAWRTYGNVWGVLDVGSDCMFTVVDDVRIDKADCKRDPQ